MSNSVDLITEKDIRSMVEDFDKYAPRELAESTTIEEFAKACEEAAELYMDPLKEYILRKEKNNV